MSYLALARKWRPKHFSEVAGQQHVLTALENALNQDRLHHAYLFSGTRGVGKTTIARLFAKGLNCETGITSTPCGQCATCQEIDQGRFVDLLEIDAASRTKVEDTRDLLDNVQYKPARGRFKVYLIDEVHMLSRHSFNALLKTLEEPPEYVKFLLATTDPQKLPVTVLSRCLQFHLKPMSADTIHQHLDKILDAEQVGFDNKALGLISHAAEGSMRDALSLTDQAIALGNGQVDLPHVVNMLGTLDTDQALHLLEAISSKNAELVINKIAELANVGVEWDGLLKQLVEQLHRVAMYQFLPSTLDQAEPDAEHLTLLAGSLSPEEVQLFYQIALKARQDLPLAPNGRIGIEMAALRMLAFRPVAPTVKPLSTLSSTDVSANAGSSGAPVAQLQQQIQPNSSAPNQSVAETSNGQIDKAVQSVQAQQQNTLSEQPARKAVSENVSDSNSPITNVPSTGEHSQTQSGPDYSDLPQYDESDYSEAHGEYGLPEPNQSVVSQAKIELRATNTVEPAPNKPSLAGLRHQLRSQRKNLQKSEPQAQGANFPRTPQTGKKSDAADLAANHAERNTARSESAQPNPVQAGVVQRQSKSSSKSKSKQSSVLDRIAQRQFVPATKSLVEDAQAGSPEPDQPYQWKPSQVIETPVSKELTPSELKKALEHEKTPEMTEQLAAQAVKQDSWSGLIKSLEIPKMVEQLALNAHFQQVENTVTLVLRDHQQHLATDNAIQALRSALNHAMESDVELNVEIGSSGETPLELRERLYQGKLQQAHASLAQDDVVQFIENRFAATLDKDSVRPI